MTAMPELRTRGRNAIPASDDLAIGHRLNALSRRDPAELRALAKTMPPWLAEYITVIVLHERTEKSIQSLKWWFFMRACDYAIDRGWQLRDGQRRMLKLTELLLDMHLNANRYYCPRCNGRGCTSRGSVCKRCGGTRTIRITNAYLALRIGVSEAAVSKTHRDQFDELSRFFVGQLKKIEES